MNELTAPQHPPESDCGMAQIRRLIQAMGAHDRWPVRRRRLRVDEIGCAIEFSGQETYDATAPANVRT